ncbi:hypothetical protein Misp06_00113 [Microbulbifer sp. NBRC 101763]|uniref:nuclear transport factor 2 family protein n=1 Tax=Microbulbifer sp. NBRC 101763 TaxID=1113820 RepID=UPI0030B1929B
MDNLQKNIEKLAILDLLAQYTLTADNHDAEGWASLFTENGRFENGNLMIRGREKLRQYLIIHSQLGTRHITSSPLYTISSDGQSATGKATTLVIAATRHGYRTIMAGQYDDKLIKINNNWLFQCRRAEAFGLPEDPDFSVLTADHHTNKLINILLDAWDKLGEPII